MNERGFWTIAIPAVGLVFVTRWPFRSEFLFSWDSANYALAMQRIDIAAHRPHPPGYLAYIAVARALRADGGDANDSLVLWNIIATALAALTLLRFAWEMVDDERRRPAFAVSAAALFITSPLLWFYGEVAEIYASETLAATVLAYLAWRVALGRRAIIWNAASIPVAAAFKLTTAILMLPLLVFAWRRAPASARFKAVVVLVAGVITVGAAFARAAPNLGELIWQQFTSSTAPSRLDPFHGADALERLNSNLRDTATAGVAMVGAINLLALAVWLVRDRRLPENLGRPIALLWMLPWVLLCTAVLIAKPGYILPVLPLACLVVAGFYTRQRGTVCTALVVAQAVVNTLHFAVLGPFPDTVTGGMRPYRTKTLVQRVASDLQPLTTATAATIRRSDRTMRHVLTELGQRCPSARPIIIAGTDARRLMWHLPNAVVIYVAERTVQNVALDGFFTPVTGESREFAAGCPVLWLSDGVPDVPVPESATRIPGLGFLIDASTVRVTRAGITFDNVPKGSTERRLPEGSSKKLVSYGPRSPYLKTT